MSVTAWPVILVDSTNGAASDTACSGAGPSTALSGTANASSDGAGTTVTLPAGTDLSGVNTDGSHVLLFRDTTAGHRQFSAINGKAGSGGATPTVTVEQAFSATITNKDWAIGGVRATVWGAVSALLLEQASSANGDAMPGWTVEGQSGHSEIVTTSVSMRRPGDTTSGPITLRGNAGAATKPLIRGQTASMNVIRLRAAYQLVQGFEVRAEAADLVGVLGVAGNAAQQAADQITLSRTSTNTFTTGISGVPVVTRCEVQRCTGAGIGLIDNGGAIGNYVHDCPGATGIDLSNNGGQAVANVVVGCATGIHSAFTGAASRNMTIAGNTVDSCSGDGIKCDGTLSVTGATINTITNNVLSNNGGYGLNFSDAGSTDRLLLAAVGLKVAGNDTYNNTSGAYHSATGGYSNSNCPWATNDAGLNPSYTGGGNYTPTNTSLKGTTFPTTVGSATNYAYPGAIQPNASGSAGMLFVPNMEGT